MNLKEEKASFFERIFQFKRTQNYPRHPIDSSKLKTRYGKWLHRKIESLPFEPFLDDLSYIFDEFGLFKVTAIIIEFSIFPYRLDAKDLLQLWELWDV